MAQKRFSKTRWLQSANKQVEDGFLSEREVNDALKIWVNDLDGKTQAEIEASGNKNLNPEWFE